MIIEILYKPKFIKKFESVETLLRDEIIEKIKLFKDTNNHKKLSVHKLHGQLKNCYSFSVNYRFRIIFQYESKNEVVLLEMGDHTIYK